MSESDTVDLQGLVNNSEKNSALTQAFLRFKTSGLSLCVLVEFSHGPQCLLPAGTGCGNTYTEITLGREPCEVSDLTGTKEN